MRQGEGFARIEHLAVDGDPASAAVTAVAAVAAACGSDALHLSVHGHLPLARHLVESGCAVVDSAVFMATAPSLVAPQIAVVHSGFG
jgi:hypothetical protein